MYRDEERWFVVQTKPQREKFAASHLDRQGFRSFCPFLRRSQRLRKGYNSVLKPAFPGYIFVRLNLAQDRWKSVNATIGVNKIVQFGEAGGPAPMPKGIVERLQRLHSESTGLVFDTELSRGDYVRVTRGPFANMCGTLISADNKERVIILLNILAGETRVRLDKEVLVPA